MGASRYTQHPILHTCKELEGSRISNVFVSGEYVLNRGIGKAKAPPETLNIVEERDVGVSGLIARRLPEYPVGDGEGDSKNLQGTCKDLALTLIPWELPRCQYGSNIKSSISTVFTLHFTQLIRQ